MCRLLMMSGITNTESAVEFMRLARDPMSVGNNMGIGYTATKSNGDFFTERWHRNEQFFNREVVMTQDIIDKLEPFKNRLPPLSVNYSLQGDMEFSDITSVTMHTRYATCGREFMNTHPFVDGEFSLVHNGIISNAEELKLNKLSTCDSEAALQSYINLGVNLDPSKAQEWIDTLEGYWAFGIFSRDANGKKVLDIVRNSASLYTTTVEGLGIVLATTPEIITSTADKLGLKMSDRPQMMASNKLFRLDAVTGNVIEKLELKDSKLNTRRTSYYGQDYANIFGTNGTTPSASYTDTRSGGWSGNSSTKEDYSTKKASSGSVISMPAYKGKMSGNEVSAPSTEVDGLDFYEDEFQQLDDTGIPMEERIMIWDELMEEDITGMLWSLPKEMIPDYDNNSDFYDLIDQIKEAYDYYAGKKLLKN